MYCSKCGSKLNSDGICEKCENNNDKKVKVIISRKYSFFGAAVKYKVFVDGKEVAKLENGKEQEVMLSPGTHQFAFDMWSASDSETITIPDNCSVFYVDTILEMGALTNKVSVISASPNKNDSGTGEGKMTGTAISGLIFGIIGIFFASVPLGIVAITLGASALKHIKVFPNDKGKVMAILSLILGIFDLVFGIIAISMLNS